MRLGQRVVSVLRETGILLFFGGLGSVVGGSLLPTFASVFLPVSELTGIWILVDAPLLGFVIECMIFGFTVGVVSRLVLRWREARRFPRNGQAHWPVFEPARPHELILGCVLLAGGFVLWLPGIGKLMQIQPRPFVLELLIVVPVLIFGFTAVGLVFSSLATRGRGGPGREKREWKANIPGWTGCLVATLAFGSLVVAIAWLIVYLTSWWVILALGGLFAVVAVAITFIVRGARRKFVKGRRPVEDDEFLEFFHPDEPKHDVIFIWRNAIARATGVDPWFIHPTVRINELYECFGTGWDSISICMEMEDVLAKAGEGTVTFSEKLPPILDRHFARSNPTVAEYITYALAIMDEHIERKEKAAAGSS